MDVRTRLLPRAAPIPDAGRLGRRMAALYRCWDGRGKVDLAALAGDLVDGGDDVARACCGAAGAVARWGGHPYHSARHHAEVATNAAVLVEIAARNGAPVAPHRRALLLAAAFSHDLNYAPAQQPRPRFEAETVSAAAMDEIAGGCGVARDDRDDIRTLILATEPGFRPRLAALCRAPDVTEDLPEPLQALASRPELVQLAAVLSDADLLSSSGLTPAWRRVQRARLERELGHRIRAADDMAFFNRLLADGFLSMGGRHFMPNLERIRQAAQDEFLRDGA